MMPLYINYPSWIHPEIFPSTVPILGLLRWYGLMYIFAFSTAFMILRRVQKEGMLDTPGYKATEDDIFSFIAWGIFFLLIGARVFSTLVYETRDAYKILYRTRPWFIFWPFDIHTKEFTGLAGMSYHGGFIGGLLGMIFWCVAHKKPIFRWVDAMVIAIPLGYTFGRLGNFLNGELYGRITTVPWGIVFQYAQRFSVSIDWVREFAEKIGMEISPTATLINLPRHPSQLYEAFFEGIVLFAIQWLIYKKLKGKRWDGVLSGSYTIGYGVFRFFIEYFREPDADIGYRIAADPTAAIYTNTSLFNISTGQILCMVMIAGGIAILVGTYFRKVKSEN